MTTENKDRAIAAGVTFIALLILLLFLFKGGMSFQRMELAEASTPEMMLPEDEE